MTRLERKLLSRGTFTWPVTKEMISEAKRMYSEVCLKLHHEERREGWEDFLPVARENCPPPLPEEIAKWERQWK